MAPLRTSATPSPLLTRQVLDMRDTCLGHATRRAANALTRHYNAALAPIGLEVTQFTTLCVIAAGRAESAAALAAAVGVDRSTLARNLAVLRRDGLVEVEPGDGRRQRPHLTGAGHDRLQNGIALWREAQASLVARLGASDATLSLATLARLRDAVG
jgi:DNA-binding MarR family transcriptional regulator